MEEKRFAMPKMDISTYSQCPASGERGRINCLLAREKYSPWVKLARVWIGQIGQA